MNNLLKILLAIFLPPVCAFIQVGLGCVLKVFTFHAEQFSAINRASKEAHLGGFEVNEGGIFGRIGLNKVRRPFFNHFRNTP